MREFKSKILIFGEYGLMKGASALSMPFAEFKGKLSFDTTSSKAAESNQSLRDFFNHLQANGLDSQLNFPLDMDRLQDDISQAYGSIQTFRNNTEWAVLEHW